MPKKLTNKVIDFMEKRELDKPSVKWRSKVANSHYERKNKIKVKPH